MAWALGGVIFHICLPVGFPLAQSVYLGFSVIDCGFAGRGTLSTFRRGTTPNRSIGAVASRKDGQQSLRGNLMFELHEINGGG
jgi:hypothetical protein